jgi:hypothetical protein
LRLPIVHGGGNGHRLLFLALQEWQIGLMFAGHSLPPFDSGFT